MIGDGYCNLGKYNTEECGYDDNDCLILNGEDACENRGYTESQCLKVGDGSCCQWDEEECWSRIGQRSCPGTGHPKCNVDMPSWIGNGKCDGGEYNTEECGYDGGDCDTFNTNYPNCTVDMPSQIGDSICDGEDYNTTECGFDGGDCVYRNLTVRSELIIFMCLYTLH